MFNINKMNDIVKNTTSFVKSKFVIDGMKFIVYNYVLMDKEEMFKYAPESLEMRGITIREDGMVFPSIHKFFNLNENEYAVLPEGELEVREKMDGSLVMPIIAKDEVFFKTKMSPFTDQAKAATSLLSIHNKEFIKDLIMNQQLMPIFEYIGPDNIIVVPYSKPKIILTQIRDINTGRYLSYEEIQEVVKNEEMNIAKVWNTDVETILEKRKTIENIEGWVVQKKNYSKHLDMVKIKTEWYLKLHHVLSPNNFRSDVLIDLILNQKIDDVLSVIPNGDKRKETIFELIHLINKHIYDNTTQIERIIEKDKELFHKNPKAFITLYKNIPYFGILMKAIRHDINIREHIKTSILKSTHKLSNARDFVNRLQK